MEKDAQPARHGAVSVGRVREDTNKRIRLKRYQKGVGTKQRKIDVGCTAENRHAPTLLMEAPFF